MARLAVGEATVGELTTPYEMSVQAVSKHVAVRERAGPVSKTKDAQRRPVRLEGRGLELMTKWIERYQRQVEERYQTLDGVLADLDADGNPLPEHQRPNRTTREEAV